MRLMAARLVARLTDRRPALRRSRVGFRKRRWRRRLVWPALMAGLALLWWFRVH